MARIRYIKPETAGDTTLAEASRDARLLYRDLWCHMDKQGITEHDAKLIKRNVFPYDDDLSVAKVEKLVGELVKIGRLVTLTHDGKALLYCPTFSKHQKFHRDEKPKYAISDSVLLAACQHHTSTMPKSINTSANSTGTGTGIGTGNGELGTENGKLATGNGNINAEPVFFEEPEFFEVEKKSKPDTLGYRASEFIAHYVREYRGRYGPETNPPIGGKGAGIAKRIVKDQGLPRAKSLVSSYIEMSQYVGRGHDLVCFEQNLAQAALKLDAGKVITRIDARHAEQSDFYREQMKRVQAGEV